MTVLAEGKVRPEGEGQEMPLKVRLMVTTEIDLKAAVRQNRFSAKLYDRLSAISLEVPPLRKRRLDILPLARHLVIKRRGEESAPELSAEVGTAFKHYAWPGNVSELEAAVSYTLERTSGETIEFSSLPPAIAQTGGDATTVTLVGDKLHGRSLRAYLRSQEAALSKKVLRRGKKDA